MTFIEALYFVKERITYKRGYALDLVDHGWAAVLRVSFMAEDATGERPGAIPIISNTTLPLENFRDVQDLMHYIRRAIRDMELHEADEWLKLDGHAPFYPH